MHCYPRTALESVVVVERLLEGLAETVRESLPNTLTLLFSLRKRAQTFCENHHVYHIPILVFHPEKPQGNADLVQSSVCSKPFSELLNPHYEQAWKT